MTAETGSFFLLSILKNPYKKALILEISKSHQDGRDDTEGFIVSNIEALIAMSRRK